MIRFGVAALLAMLPAAAQAGLEFCNEADETAYVAVGYQVGEAWRSEGWWAVEPAECATVLPDDLEKRYYYYRVLGIPFTPEGYTFCTMEDAFTIDGDTDCEARGYETAEFSVIDTGESALHFTVAMQAAEEPPADFEPEPFQVAGLFQGCMESEYDAICSFHAEGWRWNALEYGGTGWTLFMTLWSIPVNTPVTFSGTKTGQGDVTFDIVLDQIALGAPDDDPFAALRGVIQGDWQSADDPRYFVTIHGSEMFETYEGEAVGERLLQILPECPDTGMGPGLLATSLPEMDVQCYLFATADGSTLTLNLAGADTTLDFVRPN